MNHFTSKITSTVAPNGCICDAALTLAFTTIGGVSMVTRHAGLAVRASGKVAALLTHAAVHTRAVAVALALCGENKQELWMYVAAGVWSNFTTLTFRNTLVAHTPEAVSLKWRILQKGTKPVGVLCFKI